MADVETGAGDAEDFRAYQARVRGTNINENTLLATDYLNHFNEIVMMLDMVPDMPECLEDVRAWEPKSYQEHFRHSTFSDRDLAIEAYEHVPARFRAPFEETVDTMNRLVAVTVERAEAAFEAGEAEKGALIVRDASRTLQRLQDVASAIIHGSEAALDQSEIDALLED